jgi:small conductance mechanosensitive channel
VIWAADESRSIGDVFEDALPDAAMTIIVIGLAIIVWLIFARVGHRYAGRLAARTHDDGPNAAAERAQRVNTLWRVVRSLFAVTVIVVVVLTIMSIWGIPIGPLVAVGTVVGVALGFGAQDVVRDFIAGFLIVAEDQFSIGDVVTIAGVTGTVQRIELRVTVLRDLEGRVHYVPNGHIEVATNYTQEFSKVVIDVSVAYKEDIEHVLEVLGSELEDFAADPEWAPFLTEDPVILGVNELGDSSVDVRVLFVTTPDDRWTVKREFLRRIKNRLDAESIEIPFPHVTVVRDSPEPTPRDAPPAAPRAPE